MLRCRYSCTSTHASFYAAVCSHPFFDDDDVDIADNTKVSFLSLFNSPLENVWKVTTVASLSDARHHVFLHLVSLCGHRNSGSLPTLRWSPLASPRRFPCSLGYGGGPLVTLRCPHGHGVHGNIMGLYWEIKQQYPMILLENQWAISFWKVDLTKNNGICTYSKEV